MVTRRALSKVVLVTAACLSLGVPPASGGTSAPRAGKTLVIGRVSDHPSKHYKRMKPIVDYVAAKLADLGYVRGDVVIARDDDHLIRLLRRGEVDWVSETPFGAQAYHERAGARYLLRRWKKGTAEYHTVIFVRADSGIDSLTDLAGRKVAFEDEGSTSAYFVPAAELLAAGHELVRLDSPREDVPAGRVGYAFARQEVNTTNWVHKGLVDAGAFSNVDWEARRHMAPETREELRVIHRTRAFPRAIELVRGDLDPAVTARIREVLLAAESDPAAQNALKAYSSTRRFDAITDDVLGALDAVGKMREDVASLH